MMNQQFETIQKFGKNSFEANLKTLAALAEGAQALAAHTTDYVTKSLEQSSTTFEKLAGARSIDKAVEVQTDYAKQAYEGFVAQSEKTRELYAQLAKRVFDRYQAQVPAAKELVAETAAATN
jgi:hypothetical protein